MHLNHPQTIPAPKTPIHGKMGFHETGLWCQKRLGITASEDNAFAPRHLITFPMGSQKPH